MDFLLVMMKDSFALAYTFTGGTKVERGPRRGLNMIDERLGCYIPVGTRTRRVGTSGHNTRGWCWQELTSSCNCIRVQRSLKVTWRPKACFGLVGRNQRSGHAVHGWFEAQSLRRRCFLTSWTFQACLVSGPRGCCVLCTPQITLSPRIEDGIVTYSGGYRTWRNVKRQQCALCTLGKGVPES